MTEDTIDGALCDWDEDGLYLILSGDAAEYRFRLLEPEVLYNAVRAAVLPWLIERDEARASMPAAFRCDPDESGGYDLDDPKHPTFHERSVAIWDDRDKT